MTALQQGKPMHQWSHWPLKRLFFVITATVLVFLALVLALGIRQYLLYNQCRQAVADGDRLLFQFTAIKDHLNESLILGEDVNLRAFSGELQNLEKEVEGLKGNILVPDGLKAPLPTRVDLVGLEVRLRAIQEQRPEKTKESAELVRSLNGTNIILQQFRFLLSDHTQTILLGLHRIIVGALGLIVVLSCTLLYLLNRHLATPMLNLCRLTAPEGESDGDNDALCSMAMLTDRISGVLTGAGVPQWVKGEGDLTDPGQIQREALRYRYAVTGCIGSELASELTNRINGVINYTQTLIDITEQGANRQQAAAGLYQSLINEEKKTADLVAALQRVSQWQPARGASSLSLSALFRMVALVLDKPLRAESIVLSLPTECQHEVPIAAGDLWLVLLTLLQQGRRALNREAAGAQTEKRLSVECRVCPGENLRLSLVLTNSAAAWDDDRTGSVWPSLTFCTHLLQMHQASLTIEATTPGERLLLDLPCRTSVA